MTRWALRLALRLYPRRWRDARGDELEQLTEDLLDDPGERPWRVVVSTAVGALREQARPRYLTGGRLAGLGLTGAVLAAAGLGVAFLVGQGPGVDLIPASAQSTGRLSTLTGMEAVLDTQRVRVTVNGVAVPLFEIASRSVGFEGMADTHLEKAAQPVSVHPVPPVPAPSVPSQSAPTPSVPMQPVPVSTVHTTVTVDQGSFRPPVFRFSPLVAVKRAIAYQVLTDLTIRDAEKEGRVVSLATARAYAEKEDALWRSHPQPHLRGSPKPVFLTSGAVAEYQQILTIDQELTVIAGSQEDGNRTPALRRWLTGQLTENSVVIDGVPGLTPANLAASLPPNL
jgi:hypothetical protein